MSMTTLRITLRSSRRFSGAGAGLPLRRFGWSGDLRARDDGELGGISEATLYNWKAKYGCLEVSEARRLRMLEDENRKLKKLFAESVLDNAASGGQPQSE